jgi:DNA-binding LytR/AlgR family response regulator
MKTCIIIEDQAPAQRLLKKYIEDIGSLELKGVFSSALEAYSFMQKESVDLLFLDIHLPKVSGLDFLKSLPKSPLVILTTAFPDYALESYEYNVVDYLLKPFSFQRFVQSVMKFSALQESTNQLDKNFVVCKSGTDMIKVEFSSILYIEGYGDYTKIHLENEVIISNKPLREWKDELPVSFIQIHKSYLINFNSFSKLSTGVVVLKNGANLPLGRAYKEAFKNKLSE